MFRGGDYAEGGGLKSNLRPGDEAIAVRSVFPRSWMVCESVQVAAVYAMMSTAMTTMMMMIIMLMMMMVTIIMMMMRAP